MKGLSRYTVTALLLSCSSAAFAASEPLDLRPQVSLMGSYVFEDSRRGSKEGTGAYLGYTVNPGVRLGVEGGIHWHNFPSDVVNGVRRGWLEWGGNLDALYHFSRNPRLSPYAAIGMGFMRLEEKNTDVGSSSAFAHAGVGVKSLLTNRIGLRLDARFRYTDVASRQNVPSSGFREPVIRAGFFMPLGQVAPPPPPPAEPAPPPPPPPPPPPVPEPVEPEVIFEFQNNVLFAFDSSELRPEAREALDEAADMLKDDHTLAKVEVAGHTCDIGVAAYNKGLSQRRAQSVFAYLVDQGVDPDLLTIQGYGEERPKLPNTSIENRQQNRRVELIVLERMRRQD